MYQKQDGKYLIRTLMNSQIFYKFKKNYAHQQSTTLPGLTELSMQSNSAKPSMINHQGKNQQYNDYFISANQIEVWSQIQWTIIIALINQCYAFKTCYMNTKFCLPCQMAWSADVCLSWSLFALLKEEGKQRPSRQTSADHAI